MESLRFVGGFFLCRLPELETGEGRKIKVRHLLLLTIFEYLKNYNEVQKVVVMQFEIYLDSLFLLNFTMNLYVLLLLNRYCCKVVSVLRLGASAMLGTIAGLIPFWLPIGLALRFCIGIGLGTVLMLHAAFPMRVVRKRVLLLGRAIAITFFLGGGLLFLTRQVSLFRGNQIGVLLLMGGGGLLCCFFQNTLETRETMEQQCTCTVTIPTADGEISFPAYVDSGNSLYEPISGKPVSVASAEVLEASLDREQSLWRLVPYRSIGRQGLLKAYCVKKIMILWNGNRIMVEDVFLAEGEGCMIETGENGATFGLILHPKLFIKEN